MGIDGKLHKIQWFRKPHFPNRVQSWYRAAWCSWQWSQIQLFQSLFMANFGHVSWLDHHFCGLSHHVSPFFMAADQSPGLPRHFARLIEVEVQHLLRFGTETTLEMWCLSPLQKKKRIFSWNYCILFFVSACLASKIFRTCIFQCRIDFERSFCTGLYIQVLFVSV